MSMEVSTDQNARIADLTRQIEAGTYRVDAGKIVKSMLEKPWRELSEIERDVAIRALKIRNREARLALYRRKAEELQQDAAAQSETHCPIHHIMFTLRTGDRAQDCWRCARERDTFTQEMGMAGAVRPAPDASDDAYGGGWSVYHGKVTAFDWACVAACFVVACLFLVMAFK
jgi:hypothetical protein